MELKTSRVQVLRAALCFVGVIFLACPAFGQPQGDPAASEQEPKEELKFGTISTTGQHAGNRVAVDASTGGIEPGAQDLNPIRGTVRRISSNRCRAELNNTSEKNSYSVQYRVEGTNARGQAVLRKSFSSSLGPKQTATKEFACGEGLNLDLVLRSGSRRGQN